MPLAGELRRGPPPRWRRYKSSDYADRVLVALEEHEARVPALWPIEITNALLVAERRRRIKPAEIQRFVSLLGGLDVAIDSQSVAENVSQVLPLGRAHGLSAYDAAYLEVALRHAAPLATLDSRLRAAARNSGIDLFASAR